METIMNIQTATTKELIAFFNENCAVIEAEPVKRFADRKIAEARCAKILALIKPVKETKATVEKSKTRAGAIAASWADPAVKEKRVTRDKVVCNGEEFQSVRAAFSQNGLPLSKHIKFRMELKENRKGTFVHNGIKFEFRM